MFTGYLFRRVSRFGLLLALTLMGLNAAKAQESLPPEALADPDGQFVLLDGIKVYYIEAGPADGAALLLLHGFGGSTFSWRENITALAQAGYRVIAYDRPPFGLSEKRADLDLSPTAQALQLALLLDALDIESASLVGHSAGGQVIAKFATLYPERVQSLVFVAGAVMTAQPTDDAAEAQSSQAGSPIGGLFEFASNLDPDSPLARGLVRRFLTPERFVGMLSSAYYDQSMVTDEVAAGYGRILQVENWEAGFLALFSANDFEDRVDLPALAQVQVPIAIMWGEDDTWVPIERGEALRRYMAHTEVLWFTYPETGHLPMEEQSSAFNVDLLSFLTQVYQAG